MADKFMESPISDAVVQFAGSLATIPDDKLVAPWQDSGDEGQPWHGYLDVPRDVALQLSLMLNRLARDLSTNIALPRSAGICELHHRAYRDLTGALAGVGPEDFDRIPNEHEWPVRTVLSHVTETELGFSLLIGWAVERSRSGDGRELGMPRDRMAPHYEKLDETGDMPALMSQYESLHQQVITQLFRLTPDDLEAVNVWWEGYEVPVWFRMHRFETHLREHIIQVDKTLATIGRQPTEPERLARLLHGALADVEIVLLAFSGDAGNRLEEQAAEFDRCRLLLESL